MFAPGVHNSEQDQIQSFLWPLLYDIGVGYLFTTQ